MSGIPPTEPSLLIRIRDACDHEAWTRFVELYAPLVYRFLRKQGLQDADSADLTQEVLRKVAGSAQHFNYEPSRGLFRSWLFAIVHNRLTDFWRQDAIRKQSVNQSDVPQQMCDLPDAHDASAAWERDYERQLFQHAANLIRQDFTPLTWQAFWLTAVEGRQGPDVAKELDVTLATVYLAKGRVLKRLKDQVRLLVGSD